jgi:aminoglycoside phosphotransferase (APT) family kinase protein
VTNPGLNEITEQLSRLGYRLRRAWPRGPERLLLDLVPTEPMDSEPVAAQWFAAPGRAAAVAAATVAASASGPFVLQPGGADRRLPAVADRLRRPGTRLIGHRPERRAVLRGPDGGFTKIVRRDRWSRLLATARLAEALPLPTPRILDADPVAASVTTAPLPGRTLTELLPDGSGPDAGRAAGRALAALHRVDPRTARFRDLPRHDLAAEQAVTDSWLRQVREHRAITWPVETAAPPFPEPVEGQAASIGPGPSTGSGKEIPTDHCRPDQRTLIHRDLHDGQLLIDGDGRAGVLDFDLLAVGDPALDLANLLEHLQLRADQGLLSDPAPLIDAVLAGYDPAAAIMSRIPTYRELTRRRLAAVYAFRPPTCQN